jgi:2-dehydro-3-deoxyphosphooctonate aldolase (KDO 8-P synthase)
MPMLTNKVLDVAGIKIANHLPFVLIAGVNVLEDPETVMQVATSLKEITNKLKIELIFKASFDKANRSSLNSFRGPGLKAGINLLTQVKKQTGLAIITDIHEPSQAEPVASVADIIQLPAFLSRQTDLVTAIAHTGKAVQIKKAQFLAAAEMEHIINKFIAAGNEKLILCERGTSFGYNNLVVDMLNFGIMKQFNYPVTFDVTHSLQLPGGLKEAAGGRGYAVNALARAGISQGIAGLFLETHPNPSLAKCDGPCAIALDKVEKLLRAVKAIDEVVKN